jgi:hypothetical protein
MEEYFMQFALDRVLSVAGTDVIDGKVLFLADQITDPSLSFTSETEDIVDAMNNVVMVMENGRGATFGASNAFFNTQILAAQVGGEVESGDAEITKYDIVTLGEGGKAKLSATTEATKAQVYKLSTDGSLTTAEAVEGTIAAGEVTVADAAKDDKVLVVYTAKVTASEKISAFADAKNKLMNVTAEVLLRDLCKEELYYAYIVMRGKLSGEAEWGMTRDGNHAFEIRCFPEYCGDKKLVDVIIVKG